MNQSLPDFFRVKQKVDATGLGDIEAATRRALAELPASKFIRAGMKVAVGAGSRGISNYAVIVRTVCQELQSLQPLWDKKSHTCHTSNVAAPAGTRDSPWPWPHRGHGRTRRHPPLVTTDRLDSPDPVVPKHSPTDGTRQGATGTRPWPPGAPVSAHNNG